MKIALTEKDIRVLKVVSQIAGGFVLICCFDHDLQSYPVKNRESIG